MTKTLNVLASLFIIIGIFLTLENFNIIIGVSLQWPILILVVGVGFVMLFFERKRDDSALIWIGSFLIFLGIFFYCLNYISWKTLAYLWPIFLGIIGLSFLVTSIFTKKRMFTYFAILFISLFLALFIVFTVSLRLWPMSLVVFGLSLLMIEYFNRKGR